MSNEVWATIMGIFSGGLIGFGGTWFAQWLQKIDKKEEVKYVIIEEVITTLGKIKNLILLLRSILHGYCSVKDDLVEDGDRKMSKTEKKVFFYNEFLKECDKENLRLAQIYQEINLVDYKLLRLKKHLLLHQQWEQEIMPLALRMTRINANMEYEKQFAEIENNYQIVFKFINDFTKKSAEITKIK